MLVSSWPVCHGVPGCVGSSAHFPKTVCLVLYLHRVDGPNGRHSCIEAADNELKLTGEMRNKKNTLCPLDIHIERIHPREAVRGRSTSWKLRGCSSTQTCTDHTMKVM